MKEPDEKKKKKIKYVSSNNDIDEEDVEQHETLLARRFHKGKGKFKGKLPIICFNCNEVGHIATRCPNKKNYKGGDKYKSRRDEDRKDYRDKGKNHATLLKRKQKMDLMIIMMKQYMLQ